MNKRILVVDENIETLEILQTTLQNAGYAVVVADTGRVADFVSIIKPNLIMLADDFKKLSKTGDEICRELKTRYPVNFVPILLIAEQANAGALAVASSADGFITKPFDANELVGYLGSFLHFLYE